MTAQWIKFIIIAVLAVPLALSGLRAARFWRLSTEVTPEPTGFEPVVTELKQMWWSSANRIASEKSALLNRRAAFWTKVSVILACVAGLVGAWPT
jgi:hypothetical protein